MSSITSKFTPPVKRSFVMGPQASGISCASSADVKIISLVETNIQGKVQKTIHHFVGQAVNKELVLRLKIKRNTKWKREEKNIYAGAKIINYIPLLWLSSRQIYPCTKI